jgi:hypothetical protein
MISKLKELEMIIDKKTSLDKSREKRMMYEKIEK